MSEFVTLINSIRDVIEALKGLALDALGAFFLILLVWKANWRRDDE